MAMEEERGGDDDLGLALVDRFKNSQAPEHRQLVAVVSAVMEVLKDQGLPRSPTAYFAAIMAPLEQQCSAGAVETTAFLTFLSTVLPSLSSSVLRSRSERTLQILVRILRDERVPAGTAKHALSCVECLVRAADKSCWPAVTNSFQAVVQFCADVRPKVRKRAQSCAAEVLSVFRGSDALDNASDAVVSFFNDCILPFSGKGAKASKDEQKNSAVKLLHMLGAMKHILPVMSSKAVAKVIPSLIYLFGLKQSLVTRNALNVLVTFGRRSRTDVPSSTLITVIDGVRPLACVDNRDADELMTVIQALYQALDNLHAVDPDVCIIHLSASFDAITDLLASEQEEVVFGAGVCLSSLISRCIDDVVMKKNPGPIDKICLSVERSLGYQFSDAWDRALVVVSTLFEKLGVSSFTLMKGIVKVLAELQELKDEDMSCRKRLHSTLGAAVVAMGPEQFLQLLPLNMDAMQLNKARVWLIPILRQYVVGASLKYFATNIAPLAENIAAQARKLAADDKPVAAKNAGACAHSLWALLPSFCNYPTDTKDNFQAIAKLLGDSLKRYPDNRGIICSSLQILVRQNKSARDASHRMDVDMEPTEKGSYSSDTASANLVAIAAFSDKFLPLLFNLFCESPPEKRGDLQATIGAITSISHKTIVQNFFRTVIERLLDATKDANAKDNRCMLMDLALSLIKGLDHKGLSTLFAVAKPAVQDPESGVQKKGYKVLACILKEHPDFLLSKQQEIFELIRDATSACQSSAKQYRILCLQLLILRMVEHEEESINEYIALLLKEAILALKEVNKKTRDAAYEVIIGIGHGLSGVSNDKLIQFFRMVVGCSAVTGSAGEPRVISAALSAISRLVYEFPTELKDEIQRYLPSAFYLLRNYKSREVIKSLLGLMKVIVARLSKEELLPRLKEMVEAMMVWSDDSKNRFKAKVRTILEKMIRKCGFDAVAEAMPKEHSKHLVNIRKRREQEEKKKRSVVDAEEEEDAKSRFSRATTSRTNWRHTDVFSDSEDDNDGDDESEGGNTNAATRKSKATTFRSKKMAKSKTRLPEDMSERERDEPLDLLDISRTRAALSAQGKPKRKAAESDEEIDFDDAGRLIVEEDEDRGRRASKRPREEDANEEDEKSNRGVKRSTSVGRGEKRRKKAGWSYMGDEYANRKGAGGDVKRQGKMEPYAYWPLDAKLLNRRGEKAAAARKGMESVFKVAKKLEGLSVNKALGGVQKRRKYHNKAHKGGGRGGGKSARKSKR